MTLSEAIIRMRKQLNMTQPEFAVAAGLSMRSLCRLEAGQPPRAKALMGLSDLAKVRQISVFHAVFEAMLQAELVGQAEIQRRKLQSPGSARRITVEELARTSIAVENMRETLENIYVIADRAMKKCAVQSTASETLKSVAIDVEAVKEIARGILDTCETLKDDQLRYILGPGEMTFGRSEAIRCILNPEGKSKKEAWEQIESYIRAGAKVKRKKARAK